MRSWSSQGEPKTVLHATTVGAGGVALSRYFNPGEVTTIVATFDMLSDGPPSPRLQASYGIRGAEYVWHCHILEHEEHDMMHTLVVV